MKFKNKKDGVYYNVLKAGHYLNHESVHTCDAPTIAQGTLFGLYSLEHYSLEAAIGDFRLQLIEKDLLKDDKEAES